MRLIQLTTAFLVLLSLATSFLHARESRPYPFLNSARAELKVVEELKTETEKVSAERDAAESLLLGWMEAEKITDQQWAEACLIASGEYRPEVRKLHLKKLDKLAAQLRKEVGGKPAREQGEAILNHLHKNVLTQGYELSQSSLAELFVSGKFNCVSSTVLYHIQAKRLGLKTEAIEFDGSLWDAGHVFPLLIDGDTEIDIETTDADGFDMRAKLAKSGETAFGLKNMADGHKLSEKEMLCLFYNNRAVEASRAESHLEVLRTRLLALAITPENIAAQEAAEGAWINLLASLGQAKKYAEAIKIGQVALDFAPVSAGIKNNTRVAYAAYAQQLIAQEKDRELVELYAEADRNWPADDYLADQAAAFAQSARVAESEGDWERAAKILARGLQLQPDHEALENGVAFLTQESLAAIDEKQGAAAAIAWMEKLRSLFPTCTQLDAVAENHVQRQLTASLDKHDFEQAEKIVLTRSKLLSGEQSAYYQGIVFDTKALDLLEREQWEQAREVYREALKRFPTHELLVHNGPLVYEIEARKSMESEDWAAAIRVYQVGLEQFPDCDLLKQNREYCESKLKDK